MSKDEILNELHDMALDYVELLSSLIIDEESGERHQQEADRFEKLHNELKKLENNC
jgi:hypothetical protein